MTRKLLSLLAASAIALGALPPLSFAAETPVHTAAELREKGETLFTAPNTGDTTVADQPVASYWPGWVADENNSSVNYKYYAGFDDYVVQFYRDGRGTSLTSERAFFENDKNNSGLGRLIAPAAGYGRGADFVLLDFNLKVGDTGICYHDYYFRDTDGKLILAVRFDINGVWAALSASDKTNLGSLLEKNVNKRQPFSLAAWNNGDGGHGVSLEKDGVCVYTRELEGEINGFGSLDVVEGYYNADLTHTAIGGLKITAGMFGEAEPQQALDALDIPYNIDESYAFPAESLGRAVSWSGDRAVGPETKYSVVTASVDGVTKDFNIMLMGTDDDFAVAYTKMSPLSYDSREMAAVNSSMHLALRGEDGWEELNFGLGVLYAEADLDDGTAAGATRTLSAPELYRTEDGKIGVSAETRRLDGSDARNERWETEDLVHFTPVSGAAPAIDGSGRIRVNGVNGCVTGILRHTAAFRRRGRLSAQEARRGEKHLG